MDPAQIRGIILFICGFIELYLLFILWFKGKSRATFHFGWTILFLAIFCFLCGRHFFFGPNLFWGRAFWIGILVVPAYLAFIYSFTERTKYFRLKVFLWYFLGIIIVFLALTTPYFDKEISSEYPYLTTAGPLNPLGRVYVVIGLVTGLFYLLKEYFRSEGFKKWQLKYITIAIGIHAVAGIFFNGIIPLFAPSFSFDDITAIISLLSFTLIIYIIFKRQLFGIRVILTEILVGVIALILLFQALLSETIGAKIFGFITFFAFLFAGYLLIRATQKEIKRKEEAESLAEQLKHLNETLEDRVKERTRELEQSFQEIKKRKDELEKFHNLTVGRELKMVELKKEIQELKKKLKEKL